MQTYGLSFPVLPDPDLQVAGRYRVTGYPETFVIDRNGTIVAHEIGPRHWDAPDERRGVPRAHRARRVVRVVVGRGGFRARERARDVRASVRFASARSETRRKNVAGPWPAARLEPYM